MAAARAKSLRCEVEMPAGDDDSIVCNQADAHYCIRCERLICDECAEAFECDSPDGHIFDDTAM
jgi:hypothetical protein